MEPTLNEAAQAGDINSLYSSIRQDPNILERIDAIPFVDTPLHVALSVGHIQFALEIIRLKPSFGKKLNPDGLSPLDLALRNGNAQTVKRIIKFDSQLIRVQGREGYTPLHYVAETDEIDLLAEFLCVCPESIEDLTIRDESAVHVAVKNLRLRAFNVLSGWLSKTRRDGVLNWRDEEGNTVLHIAVSTSQPQVVRKLINDKVRTDIKNLEGMTARDMASRLPMAVIRENLRRARAPEASSLANDDSLAELLSSGDRFYTCRMSDILYLGRDLSTDVRNCVFMVAVLLATATYQAVLSPPGGVWQGQGGGNNNNTIPVVSITTANSSSATYVNASSMSTAAPMIIYFLPQDQSSSNSTTAAGKVVMGPSDFITFFFLNSLIFLLSMTVIGSILFKMAGGRYSRVLCACLVYLSFSYWVSLFIISPSRTDCLKVCMGSLFFYHTIFVEKCPFFFEKYVFFVEKFMLDWPNNGRVCRAMIRRSQGFKVLIILVCYSLLILSLEFSVFVGRVI